MQPGSSLENISIVLVQTKTPANIGAVARCMMNMGLSRLVLVDPPRDPNRDALKLAAGADEILERASIYPTLREAIAEQSLVIGASRHTRRRRSNVCTPREAAGQIPLTAGNKACFVFGNEVTGLERDHLALCHEIVSIPSSPKFPSLNLSHAVMVIAYELFIGRQENMPAAAPKLATEEDLQRLYEHLQRTLEAIEFLDPAHPNLMMHSLRQVFGRSRLDSRETSIFRGILTAIDRSCKRERNR